MSGSRDFLDQAYSLARVEALAPNAYAQLVASEVSPATTLADFSARDAQLIDALAHIDATIVRVMRLRLDHALADDTSIARPTRNVFASTIVKYADNLALLEERARDVAQKGRAADPAQTARLVVDAARATFTLRDALREGVLALIRDLASASIADADGNARDRKLDDATRKQWSAVRRDLEMVAADPHHVLTAPSPQRLAALPEQLDEPAPEREATFADMIELD
jgi:hypothetical protein